ncbi:small ribosomal subunit biogenesis GTPase RsgA 1, mitochondrial-like [Ipomoea triloba]|uniref:small ribosomal subunit biogenesis GTPase RsgA 1, mitochondrial-like n=1 Tax=Ipomoea triloba TaxID=35885 RepID=UPI00125E5755|nr:small ribosomal subunit biogenesis GTPase RsgA 1, mitochondrial-like [Ipomoea triloba]XP_031129254.1 small ribosomal subunit biogenesis GTPase RsgA 1, mitochondrial-like [Ipomoea triloba]XP_031129255.1 small ribosomal subunit biogenesis GTPase RsgA 1, mitochondrial-like [Ipomoea triloba]XP_031129256.1 small ribosomal subunit biogenesis GTPase RsgA 1, mitochondrial-like [Ipomoea triloba]XP_031129257.1 small ribosomal subunit biogenesis GTPase RsgA 1, mitochondrial-like [Ipomoea triloba]XP_03
MKIASMSLLRPRVVPLLFSTFSASASRNTYLSSPFAIVLAARHHHQGSKNAPRKLQQPNKNLLKARETIKQFSPLAPVLSSEDKTNLSQDQAVGMVAASQANFMRVIVQSLPSEVCSGSGLVEGFTDAPGVGVELLCVVKAVLKKIKRRVLVGDKVLVGSIDWVDRRGMIENVFERKCEILDPPVANVDHLLVLFSMEQPKLEPFSLTRFLIEAESTGIPFTLALNKCELVPEETLAAWKSRLRKWGYEPIFCSVESQRGIDTLLFIMREQTSVIVGPSGVGKSSLINAMRFNKRGAVGVGEGDNCSNLILDSKWFEEQRVGEVSTRSGRGKHTTRNVSLLPLSEGGYLADTPGFCHPSLMKVTKQSLAEHFPEIQKMLKEKEPAKCSFSNCLHLGEPGCLVGGDWERYPYYLQLLDEIKIREEFQLRVVGTKRESDVRYKVGDKGVIQAEPRLEPKKHRRQSRKRLNQSVLDELDELDDEDEETLDDDNPILRAMKQENS